MTLQPTAYNPRPKNGFSLIEVLVFITIMSLVFVTAASVVAISLGNLKINEHKLVATRYGERLIAERLF